MIRITNEVDLLGILKTIAKESKTGVNLLENDSAQERYKRQVKVSERKYGVSLAEKEEAEDQTEQDDVSSVLADEEDTGDGEEGEASDNNQPEKEIGEPEEFGYSFDSVVKNINTLRAGRSTKDKEIKDELLTYYDRLDDDERKILHLFLRELSKILRGAIEGDDALDPSDAPLFADIILGDEEGTTSNSSSASSKPEKQMKVSTDPESSEENTAPPIKVNESQNLSEIRRRFKNLSKRL